MENNNKQQQGLGFLSNEHVQKHFVELNIELLKGCHIMPSSPGVFSVLDEFYEEFYNYYHALYGLMLEKRVHDNVTYFYLEFPQVGKGELSDPRLYQELDAKSTIVACILSNLYFSNYFSYDKKFHWDEIQYEIENGEHKEAYQQLFFEEVRPDYTDNEWKKVKKNFQAVINFFHRIGLVEKLDKEDSDESIHFTILPTIHHFIELYKNEIENIDSFLKEIKL